MQEVLLNHTSSLIRFHFCDRLKKYNRTSSGIELTFWNGKNVTCDLLIGADGINSTVRNLFLAEGNGSVECSRPKWTGTVAYRSLVEAEDVRRVNPQHPALERYMVVCNLIRFTDVILIRCNSLSTVLWKKQGKHSVHFNSRQLL